MYCAYCGSALDRSPPVRCPNCGVVHYRNAVPSGGAIIEREGHVLLVQRAHSPYRGDWDIPGGFCEEGELPADAARREVREETGLEIQIGALVGMWHDAYERPGQPTRATLNVYFLARLAGDEREPSASAEVRSVAWFDEASIPGNLAFPTSTRAAIECAFRALRRFR